MLRELKRKYIGDSKFYKLLFSVSFPIIVQNGMTNLVSLLDNVMVGQMGLEEMSGVAIVNQLIFVYYLLIFGGLSGVGIFTAQYYGNNDHEGIRHTFRYKLWLGFIISSITIIVFVLFGQNLIHLYLLGDSTGGDARLTLAYGMDYMWIVLFMIPAILITQLYASTLRECGETVIPMVAGIIAVFSNLVLDYALIFGKLGLPAMGVSGAALATVIARYIEMLVVVVWTIIRQSKFEYLKGVYRTLIVPGKLVGKFLITGVPLLVNEGLWAIGIAMLTQAYSLRGINVIAGQNIASTVNNLFSIVFIAMGDAVAIIIGQYLGAGDMENAKDADNKIIAFSILSSVVIGSIMFFMARPIPQIYNTSEISKLIATQFIMVQAIAMPKDCYLHTSYFTIRAGGKTVITFLFDSVFMIFVSVPLAYILVRFTDLYASLVFAIVHSADIIKCIIGYILIKKGVWLKNIVK